jgi:hypothetical protein
MKKKKTKKKKKKKGLASLIGLDEIEDAEAELDALVDDEDSVPEDLLKIADLGEDIEDFDFEGLEEDEDGDEEDAEEDE